MHLSKRKVRNFIIVLLFLLVILAVGVIRSQLAKTIFNEDYVNGNSAGNLYNGGLFCESNGMIFFSNPNDHHRLYSMTSSGEEVTKLSDDTVSYINADDNYVYYSRDNSGQEVPFSFLNWNNSLCRVKRTGGDVILLDNDPCHYSSLVGNYIYYIHYDTETASQLYRVRIDGEEKQQVSREPYFTCCAVGQNLYYNGVSSDHYIYQRDTATNAQTAIYQGNTWQPIIVGQTAYYMDCDNGYALTSVDLTTQETFVITEDRIECFNISGNIIYYQRNDSSNPALCRIYTDGTGYEEIASGNYTALHFAGGYLYYYRYGNDSVCYRTPASGSINISTFQPR